MARTKKSNDDFQFYKDNIIHLIITEKVPNTLDKGGYIRFIGYDSLEASYQAILVSHLLNELKEYDEYSKLDLTKITIKNVSDKIYLLIPDDEEQKQLLKKAIETGDLKRILLEDEYTVHFLVAYRGLYIKISALLKEDDNNNYTIVKALSEQSIPLFIEFFKRVNKEYPELTTPIEGFLITPNTLTKDNKLNFSIRQEISTLIKEGINNEGLGIINTSAIKYHTQKVTMSYDNVDEVGDKLGSIINELCDKYYKPILEKKLKEKHKMDKILRKLKQGLYKLMVKKDDDKEAKTITVTYPFAIGSSKKEYIKTLYKYVKEGVKDIDLTETQTVYRVYVRFLGKPYKFNKENGVYPNPKASTNREFPKYITYSYMYLFTISNIVHNIKKGKGENVAITPIITNTNLEFVRAQTKRNNLNKEEICGEKGELNFNSETTLQGIIPYIVLTILDTTKRIYTKTKVNKGEIIKGIGGLSVVYDDNTKNKMLKYANDITLNLKELRKITPEIDNQSEFGIFKMYLCVMTLSDKKFKGLKNELTELLHMYFITGNEMYITLIPIKIIQTIKSMSKEEVHKYNWFINKTQKFIRTMNKFLQTH